MNMKSIIYQAMQQTRCGREMMYISNTYRFVTSLRTPFSFIVYVLPCFFFIQIYNKYLQEVGDTVQVGQTQTLSLPE